jgi:HK97 family phage portal protein
MGLLLSRIFNWSLEDPAQPLLPMSALFESLGLGRSDAGVMVNQKQALRLSTVYSCIKVIAQDLSRVSLDIYESMPDGTTRKATDHRFYTLLHSRPNRNMSSMVWRMAMIASMLMSGSGYSYINRDSSNRVVSLTYLDPEKTHPDRDQNGNLIFVTRQTPNGDVAILDPDDVLHFMPFTLDGIRSVSPIGMCKNAVGIGLAAEKFGAQLFGNGARPSGYFRHPGSLESEAYENLKKSLHEVATGETALRPILLEEGMEWHQLTIPPEEAQFLETRKFQKEEIAQLYRVPLHLLQDLTRSTNNNIEHQGLDYTRYCLAPIAACMEQEINFKLLGLGNYSVSHNMMDLQRGDFATVTTALCSLRNAGIYSLDDCLRSLNENTVGGEVGTVRIVNGTFKSLDQLLKEAEQVENEPDITTTKEPDTNVDTGSPVASRKVQMLNAYRPLIRDAVGRAVNRGNDIEFIKKAFQPVANSMLQTFLAAEYGFTTMNKTDMDFIGTVVSSIANDAPNWTRGRASELATELTEKTYAVIEAYMTNTKLIGA